MGYVGRRTMAVLLGLVILGLGIFLAGVAADDRTLRGAGLLCALMFGAFALSLLIRWLWYRGVG
jgi:hypothetical protein